MANHSATKKSLRQAAKRRLHNRYYAITMRNAVRKLRATNNKEEAQKQLPLVTAMLDKLAKTNVIHKNKASNLKSKLTKLVNNLA